MFHLILATCNHSSGRKGIGIDGKLPWHHCKEDMDIFRETTLNHIIIFGRRTLEGLPRLGSRTIFCLTTNPEKDVAYKGEYKSFSSLEDIIEYIDHHPELKSKKIFIGGGGVLYDYVLNNYFSKISEIHLSSFHREYDADTFAPDSLNPSREDYEIIEKRDLKTFTYYRYQIKTVNKPSSYVDEQGYLQLVEDVLQNGEQRPSRSGDTVSLFAPPKLSFDLRRGFPLLTTKKMFTRGVIEELLFFLRGETDSKILEDKNVNIWKGNTSRDFLDSKGFKDYQEGEMGPMYGYQWRSFNRLYVKDSQRGLDQLQKLVREIRSDPFSRRHLMTTYNPLQVEEGVLYPCHSVMLQFYVGKDGYLDMFSFNRSSDLGLGLPFNIASSALLLIVVATLTNLKPRTLDIQLGDAHIYQDHIEALREQIERIPYTSPKMIFKRSSLSIDEIPTLTMKDFELKDYRHHEKVVMDMAV